MVATLARAKGVTLGQVAEALGIHRNRPYDVRDLAELCTVKPWFCQ